jgi:hypothetical protein
MHPECEKVSSEIWEFADPWDGMDSDCYKENVREVFRCFVCCKCEHREECKLNTYDNVPCGVDWFETYKQTLKLNEIFKTKYLTSTKRDEFGNTYFVLKDIETEV